MKPNTRAAIFRLFLAILVNLGIATTPIAPIRAQAPTPKVPPTATPVPETAPVRLLLTANADPDPLLGGDRGQIELTLSAIRAPDAVCYGIPLDPLDLFFVVDNSGSAGKGPGSNLELTRQWLNSFVTFAKQQAPVGNPPQRSRIGLAASRVEASGTELLWQTLTEDYAALHQILNTFPSGGDTELASGIQEAATALKQRSRPQARQVLVLMLHDRLPLTDAALTEVATARQAGIEVYLFANSLKLEADQVIDTALAHAVVAGDHFLSDPTSEDLHHIFVRMTGGSTDALAQNIVLTMLVTPDGLTKPELSPPGIAVTNTVSWLIPQLTAQRNAELLYRGAVGPLSAHNGQMNLTAQMTYQDCNGHPRAQTVALVFRTQAPAATATPSPTPKPPIASPTLAATENIPATSTPRPGAMSLPTATPPGTGIVLPTPTNIQLPGLPHVDLTGPIDQFLVWLVGLVPSISTAIAPLLGIVPVALQWIAIILLILLLLFLLWRLFKILKKLWGRRGTSSASPGGTPPPPSPPPTPPSPTLPQWISELPDNALLAAQTAREVATTTPHLLQDTLIIGLGEAGREVLTQVAAGLKDRFAEECPGNIHLLQVDVVPVGASQHLSPPPGLRDEQWVLLRPDFKEIAATLRAAPQDFVHWQRYEAADADDGRARGRMALFNDVKNGSNNSVLWQALTRALQGLSSPTIRIIGTSFDDVSSGMLVDMARLAQLAATSDTNGSVDVQLWLAAPVGRDWSKRLNGRGKIRVDEQKSRALATLRELERFQRNAPVLFRYVPDTNRQDLFRATCQHALINKIVLFEPQLIPPIAPEDDVMVCITDTLLALLNQEANSSWNGHLAGTDVTMGNLANKEGQGAALAIGSYALRYPGTTLAQSLAWRMVRDTLFERALGLYPMEQLDITNGKYQLQPEGERGRALGSIPGPRPKALDKLVHDYKGNWHTKAFEAAVRTRVNALLNGEAHQGEPLVMRRAGLAQAIRWLKLLRGTLLQNDVRDVAQKVNALEKELSAWQRWLQENVYPSCEQHFETAHAELERLRKQPARNWGVDATQEWNLYRKHIRAWEKEPTGNAQAEPLLRLAARFGWDVQIRDDGWRPRLIVPPGEFNTTVEPQTLELLRSYELTLHKPDPEAFLQSLFALASRMTYLDMRTSLLETALREDPAAWLQHARPRAKYNSDLAAARMHQVDHLTLLVAPESADHTPKLKQRLDEVPDIPGRFELCQTNDPTSVTLVRATSWLPLSTLYMYNEDAWNVNPVSPATYVWRPEQIAAEMEGDRRLSSLLVSRIAENEPLLRAFGLAFIYEVIDRDTRGWHVPGMTEAFDSLSDALETVFAGDSKTQDAQAEALRMAVNNRPQQIVERRAYLRRVEKERIVLLQAGQTDTLTQDFAIYVRGLIAKERGR